VGIASDKYQFGYIRDIEKGEHISRGTFLASGSSPGRKPLPQRIRLREDLYLDCFVGAIGMKLGDGYHVIHLRYVLAHSSQSWTEQQWS
jgi:hypothetical protein